MTPKQLQLLRFIRNKIVHASSGPTFKEMREYMEVSSNQTIDDFLSSLEREGYIKITQGKQRGIEITNKAQEVKEQKLEYPATLPETFTTISRNASTSFAYSPQNVNGINLQSNGILPWRKGGEKNGTT